MNLEDTRIYYKIILNVIYKPNIDSLSWGNSQDFTCKQDVCETHSFDNIIIRHIQVN